MKKFDPKNIKNSKIRILPPQIKTNNTWLDEYIKHHTYNISIETDEDKLKKIDIKIIEKFLRNKKLKNINNKNE